MLSVLKRPPRLRGLARGLTSLVHDDYGPPYEVMRLQEEEDISAAAVGPREVLARMLLSPVNPADVNMIQAGGVRLGAYKNCAAIRNSGFLTK